MRYLREALAIDPVFAPAMASLAFCYAVLPITSLLRPHDCFPAAQNLASDALSLDASQTDAHIALGLVDFWYRRDWDAARRHFLAVGFVGFQACEQSWVSWFCGAENCYDGEGSGEK